MKDIRINFLIPARAHKDFKSFLQQNTDVSISEAFRSSMYFIMGMKGKDLKKFFILARKQRLNFQANWLAEQDRLFYRVEGMQLAIEEAIEKKLISETLKEKMIRPGGLAKIEAAFNILEAFKKKRLSEKRVRAELAIIAKEDRLEPELAAIK